VQKPPLQILKQIVQKRNFEYWKRTFFEKAPEDGQHHCRKTARSFSWKCLLCNGGMEIKKLDRT
jgi:hypothetical protein